MSKTNSNWISWTKKNYNNYNELKNIFKTPLMLKKENLGEEFKIVKSAINRYDRYDMLSNRSQTLMSKDRKDLFMRRHHRLVSSIKNKSYERLRCSALKLFSSFLRISNYLTLLIICLYRSILFCDTSYFSGA